MLLTNKNDWWSTLIRISVLVGTLGYINEKFILDGEAGLGASVFDLAFLFAVPLMASTERWKGHGLLIAVLLLTSIVFLIPLSDGLQNQASFITPYFVISAIPTLLATPKVLADRYKQHKSGEKRAFKLFTGGLVFVFLVAPVLFISFLIVELSELEDPEVMKKSGIRHAEENIIPELWLDQYPSEKIQIEDAYYELWQDLIAGATFKIDPSIDLHQYVKDHPIGKSKRWGWREVRDGSGKIVKYQARLLNSSVQVEQFTHDQKIIGDRMATYLVDVENHEITYTERDD
jgi:hypothetical protein